MNSAWAQKFEPTSLWGPKLTFWIELRFPYVDVPRAVVLEPAMTMFLLNPSEPEAPGAGNVRVAGFVAMSTIPPPLSVRALVDV